MAIVAWRSLHVCLVIASFLFALLLNSCAQPPPADCRVDYCFNNGVCTKTGPDQYLCVCPSGFTGPTCEVELEDYTVCEPGYFSIDGLIPCQKCGLGTYQPSTGQMFCINCTIGTNTTQTGSINEADCIGYCEPGYASTNGLVPCIECMIDTYQPSRGQTVCVDCPPGTKTEQTRSTAATDCVALSTASSLVESTTKDESCAVVNCANNGICFEVGGVAHCDCTNTGYGGMTCTRNATGDPCIENNPCENNGLCYIEGMMPDCYCEGTGYEGKFCERVAGSGGGCRADTCLNGGLCVENDDSGVRCECAPEFRGPDCGESGSSEVDSTTALPPPPPSALSTMTLVIIIAVAVGVILILIFIICVAVVCNSRGRREPEGQKDVELYGRPHPGQKPVGNTRYTTYGPATAPRNTGKKGCFDRKNLTFFEQLGSGAFAVVYRAKAIGIVKKGIEKVVAVKMLKESATEDDKSNFVKEVQMYNNLTPHPNVINMLGSCIEKEPLYIIMEFAPHGNLYSHLEKIRSDKQSVYTNDVKKDEQFLTPTEIMNFAVQIARGMTYLASEKCVHRDLATRNILLGDNFVCKVSDFGLARDITEGNEYEMKSRGRVPLRWMALESLLHNMYSSQTDVWSFGIVLWELVTLGSHPYPGMSGSKIITELQRGYRLPKPEHCSSEIYSLMMSCWEEQPDKRPTFSEALHKLEAMLDDASGYLVMSAFQEHNYIYLQPDQEALDD